MVKALLSLSLFSLAGGALLLSGCKGKDPAIVAPGELTVYTTISIDGSGLVNFRAVSQNALRFTFLFGEGLDEPKSSITGNESHTYVSSGTYTVTVVAAADISVTKTMTVTVQVKEPVIFTAGYRTPDHYDGKTLVWQDEFTGDHLNTEFWNYETGPFNHELQYYKEENTTVDGGYLIIRAKVEKVGDKIYTSSRLTTQGKKVFQFGRIDIRATMPKGQGMFPALWMLGSTFSTLGWPKCGEIDIMETIGGGGRDSVVYGTAHWDNAGTHASYGGAKGLMYGHVLGDQFHVYSIEWTATSITWYIDDVPYHVIDITPAELDELTKEFFFVFNLAIGGEWAGNPDADTHFPQRMVVDYIRVFQ